MPGYISMISGNPREAYRALILGENGSDVARAVMQRKDETAKIAEKYGIPTDNYQGRLGRASEAVAAKEFFVPTNPAEQVGYNSQRV